MNISPLPRSTPEAQGMPSFAILAFIDAAESAGANLHSLMLVRHGHVIAEGWWAPYEPSHRRYVYSLTKSITSTAVGLAVAEGLLRVEDRVATFFPDCLPQGFDENLATLRVRDLLTMTSGHAMDSAIGILIMPGVKNWAQALLAYPFDNTPGTHFVYDSGNSHLLSAIVQKVSGQALHDYLTPRLFEPLGIGPVPWDTTPDGVNTGGWGLSLATEEIARFGLLYLQKGLWNGSRLLPEAWIAAATGKQVGNNAADRENEPVDWRQGYGYQFWRCRHNAYRADGAFGQYCVVMPDQDAVLVMTSATNNMQIALDATWDYLLPAMASTSLPENPQAQALLRNKLDSLKIPTPQAEPHPYMAGQVSGKRFLLDPNQDGMRSATFQFAPDSSTLTLESASEIYPIQAGSGTWVKNKTALPILHPNMMNMLFDRPVQSPLNLAAAGTWKDPDTYVLTIQYLETPHSEAVTCQFHDGGVRIEFSSSIKDPNNPFLQGKDKLYTGMPS